MSRVTWSVEGPDGAAFEVNGHKFATNDDGAPMMCNLYCADLGRHVHVDYCRSQDPATCRGPEIQHISTRVQPNPERAKDWVTHNLHWKRMGAPRSFPSRIFTDALAGFKGMSPQRKSHVTNGICRSILQGRSGQVRQVVSTPSPQSQSWETNEFINSDHMCGGKPSHVGSRYRE